MNPTVDVVVAGHLCLDVIPTFDPRDQEGAAVVAPGRLLHVGPAVTSTGGAVANTGLSLHRLGTRTRLLGKLGDDLFGHAILEIIGGYDPALAAGVIVDPAVESSYTIVISPPGVDRSFLHCPGANDQFGADDVGVGALASARIFHFGYPPLMRRMYADGGAELAAMFRRVKAAGLLTSLDMADVDPASSAGSVDWPSLLAQVLPHVDLFVPSVEEVLFMLEPVRFQAMLADSRQGGLLDQLDGALLSKLAGRLLDLGAAVVGLKLGGQGLYLRTSAKHERLASLKDMALSPAGWAGCELLAPAFQVQVVGTTGAGDCAIAGFLTALLRGLTPSAAMTSAVAAGACNVECADALGGVPTWDTLQQRIAAGWERRATDLPLEGWRWEADAQIWRGPHDAGSSAG